MFSPSVFASSKFRTEKITPTSAHFFRFLMKDLWAQFYTVIPQLLLGDHLISHLLQEMSPRSVKKDKNFYQLYLQNLAHIHVISLP